MRSVLIQAQQEIRRFGEIDKRTIKLLAKGDIHKLETDRRIVERKNKTDKRLAERRGIERNHSRRPSGPARTRFSLLPLALPFISPLLRGATPDEQPRLRGAALNAILKNRWVSARKTIAGRARLCP